MTIWRNDWSTQNMWFKEICSAASGWSSLTKWRCCCVFCGINCSSYIQVQKFIDNTTIKLYSFKFWNHFESCLWHKEKDRNKLNTTRGEENIKYHKEFKDTIHNSAKKCSRVASLLTPWLTLPCALKNKKATSSS